MLSQGIRSFKQNPMSIVDTSINETTGREKKRYINRFRWKSWSVTPMTISEREVGSTYDLQFT
jgi:general transcription factor 3C polypeptide 5 (transcription factor C subunit 1)